jgi:(2Fe-2S) ferredoxin
MRAGGEEVTLAIRDQIAQYDAVEMIHTTRTRCNGRCEDACVVIDYPDGVWYKQMSPEDGRELVSRIVNGQAIEDKISYLYNWQGKCFLPAINHATTTK